MAQVLSRRRARAADTELEEQVAAVSAPASVPPPAAALLALQRSAGNHAVAAMVQRQFTDNDRQGEAPLFGGGAPEVVPEEGEADGDAEIDTDGVALVELDDDEEADGRGPAPEAHPAGETEVAARSEFGEMDGAITSDLHACAMTDLDRTGEDLWHHCGGSGGKGVENLGDATLVAPSYKTGPSTRAGGKPKAWIEDGTGTVDVTRSFWGVPRGAQGAFVQPPPGTVWMTSAAKARVDKHERTHAASQRAIHDRHVAPLEQRIAKRRGPDHPKRGDTEKDALAALQAEIKWDDSIKAFADEEKAENSPLGPVDQRDMATADFYDSYGKRKIHGVVYTDYYDVPPGPKSRKKKPKKKKSGSKP